MYKSFDLPSDTVITTSVGSSEQMESNVSSSAKLTESLPALREMNVLPSVRRPITGINN